MKYGNLIMSIVSSRFVRACAVLAFSGTMFLSHPARAAGIFNTPHFTPNGEFALGLEPEVVLTSGAGVGLNARFTLGVTDLDNASIILGWGSGPRQFRGGGNFTFDFFPDIEGQPGIGLATQAIYYRLPSTGVLELTLIPYIHKQYKN